MHAQCQREFASMQQIMFEDMPDDPLPQVPGIISSVGLSLPLILEFFLKVGRRPAGERLCDHPPGRLQPHHDFDSGAGRLIFVIPCGQGGEL